MSEHSPRCAPGGARTSDTGAVRLRRPLPIRCRIAPGGPPNCEAPPENALGGGPGASRRPGRQPAEARAIIEDDWHPAVLGEVDRSLRERRGRNEDAAGRLLLNHSIDQLLHVDGAGTV